MHYALNTALHCTAVKLVIENWKTLVTCLIRWLSWFSWLGKYFGPTCILSQFLSLPSWIYLQWNIRLVKAKILNWSAGFLDSPDRGNILDLFFHNYPLPPHTVVKIQDWKWSQEFKFVSSFHRHHYYNIYPHLISTLFCICLHHCMLDKYQSPQQANQLFNLSTIAATPCI